VAIPSTPYLEVRAAAQNPANLPHDVLYRDYIRGSGAQVFRLKTAKGNYTVHLLRPDRTETVLRLTADGCYLNVTLPEGEWSVSGLVVRGPASKVPLDPQTFPKVLPRPSVTHEAPHEVVARQSLTLNFRIVSTADVSRVRLYYRPVDQQAKFKSIEFGPGQNSVTIPGDDISAQLGPHVLF